MSGSRALFLDRDGVINHDSGYTSNTQSFEFIDGIFELCQVANSFGYLLIVVTNQSGIGRGYYSEQDFLSLTHWMCQRFEERGIKITDVFHCPYHPTHGVGHYKKESLDRKPNPGMLFRAAEKYELNMELSIMIGDKDSDMQAAYSAGVGTRCHYMADGLTGPRSTAATHDIQVLSEGVSLLSSFTFSSESRT